MLGGLVVLAVATLACEQSAEPAPTTLPTQSPLIDPQTFPDPPTSVPTIATPAQAPVVTSSALSVSRELGDGILIGMEYVLIDAPRRAAKLAEMLSGIGAPGVKPFAEHIEWGAMQSGPDAAIDYMRVDTFVREFQAAGFSELVVTLKSHSSWASIDHQRLRSVNAAPKPEYLDLYAYWVQSIVERYDADGVDDMPGLLRRVRFYEIGTEFTTYEPGPVADYLTMLERAYEAAHTAFDDVLVAHVAFLTASVFEDHPGPAEYEQAWASAYPKVTHHSLADHRAILDRPDIFDLANAHALTDPYEVKDIVARLNYEMVQRGYRKPIIISDTLTTPFIAYGPATSFERLPNQLGLLIQPAIEVDRCRLAAYFSRLLSGDQATLRWTQAFAAEDTIKRVVIAAEQDVALINTAFTEDLAWLKLPVVQAGAGTSAWAGFVDLARAEYRPSFYALKQLVGHLGGYTEIKRVDLDQPGARAYEVSKGGHRLWIAWYDPGRVVLPGEPVPKLSVDLVIDATHTVVEPVVKCPRPTFQLSVQWLQ